MRQEEEQRRLEEQKQAEMLLRQIEELKLQETEVTFSFSSSEKDVFCFTWKCSNTDLASSLQVSTRLNLEQSCDVNSCP